VSRFLSRMRAANLTARMRELVRGLSDRIRRGWVAQKRGRAFDQKYGTDTQGRVEVESLGIEGVAASHAVHYEPSSLPKVERALRRLPIRHEDYCFVDMGAGKGLAIAVAARYPFRRVIGVEVSRALCQIAANNLRLYRDREKLPAPVDILNINALDYRFSDDHHVVYLYNPFDEGVLAPMLAHLLARPDRHDFVAYVNPVHKKLLEDAFVPMYDDEAIAIYRRKFGT
jgi:SAM-dependent methyltransferase